MQKKSLDPFYSFSNFNLAEVDYFENLSKIGETQVTQ